MSTIFGYTWEAIQRAQAGGRLHERIDTSKPIDHAPTDADRALLAQHESIEALKAAGFYGSADRLERYAGNGNSTTGQSTRDTYYD